MARIKLDLPKRFPFRVEIDVRQSDMNQGGHLGNDRLLTLINEARVKFYNSYGYHEGDIEGAGTIMSDAVIVYKSESYSGDTLAFEVAAGDFTRVGCDLFYRVINARTGVEVAQAKTAITFFDYQTGKVKPVPQKFRDEFIPVSH